MASEGGLEWVDGVEIFYFMSCVLRDGHFMFQYVTHRSDPVTSPREGSSPYHACLVEEVREAPVLGHDTPSPLARAT